MKAGDFLAASLAALLAGCAPAVTYVPLKPAGPPKDLAERIDVFVDDREIPEGVSVVGEVRVGDTGFSTGCDLNSVIALVKDKARAAGADAVYLARVVEPDFTSTCYRVTARLLKYGEAPTAIATRRRVQAVDVPWRRAEPAPTAILQIHAGNLNVSANSDRFQRAIDAVVGLSGNRGSGSGFFITRDGLALTNHHVVENQDSLEATLRDGRRVPARVLRSDANADVALVQVHCATDCFTLDLAKSNPRVGSDVYAIGNPLTLDFTITRGVVSGLRLASGVTLLQTDAALNQGNSGGPIIASETNEAVAVVSWKITGRGAEGLGFGISIGDALRVLGVSRD